MNKLLMLCLIGTTSFSVGYGVYLYTSSYGERVGTQLPVDVNSNTSTSSQIQKISVTHDPKKDIQIQNSVVVSTTTEVTTHTNTRIGDKSDQTKATSGCGIDFTLSKGEFTPTWCGFELVSRGEECSSEELCSPRTGVVFSMKDEVILRNGGAPKIYNVSLIYFSQLTKGLYTYKDSDPMWNFSGQLLDVGGVARPLESGYINMNPLTDGTVEVSFALTFATNIIVKGAGTVSVVRVSAP
jgi:hypothetical protein